MRFGVTHGLAAHRSSLDEGDRKAGRNSAVHFWPLNMKLELVAVPVTDVDRAKAFYVDQVGFHADHDHQVSENLRFVKLTPPGSDCSIVMGVGITGIAPLSQHWLQCVVSD